MGDVLVCSFTKVSPVRPITRAKAGENGTGWEMRKGNGSGKKIMFTGITDFYLCSASTGEVCGELIYHEEVMRVLEAELYLAHVSRP